MGRRRPSYSIFLGRPGYLLRGCLRRYAWFPLGLRKKGQRWESKTPPDKAAPTVKRWSLDAGTCLHEKLRRQ